MKKKPEVREFKILYKVKIVLIKYLQKQRREILRARFLGIGENPRYLCNVGKGGNPLPQCFKKIMFVH